MTIFKFSDLVGVPRHITKQAFLLRLTPTERKAIRQAALSDEDVADFMEIFDLGKYVDLDRKELREGLAYMVYLNILTPERLAKIVSDPIMDYERY